jgi:hypothetical protein
VCEKEAQFDRELLLLNTQFEGVEKKLENYLRINFFVGLLNGK